MDNAIKDHWNSSVKKKLNSHIALVMHSCDHTEKESYLRQIVDMNTIIRFCIQAG
uniref:HTH myb-type domain-containing protein n=1 Tax=Vitis vinifera TaxID=29760 RepID=F6HCY9_VITVI